VQDVGELLARSPRARDAVLVGGQALNVWAVNYGLAAETAAVSDDIDFFGGRSTALAAGLDWHSHKIHTPAFDDHSPNAAVVFVEIENSERGIDFLDQILGVDSDELRKSANVVRGAEYSFRVMHPMHVLQSQLENTYGALHRRDEEGGDYYAGRVRLAVAVVAAHVGRVLEEQPVRAALKLAERIGALASVRSSLEAFHRDRIDVLSSIPTHPAWPAKFVKDRLPRIRVHVDEKRRKSKQRADSAARSRE
jgi:hypothetical protein